MKLYLAETQLDRFEDVGAALGETHFLMSYHYFNTFDFASWLTKFAVKPNIFLDSGAWSAYTQGVTIKIDDYVKFVHTYKDCFELYCNLDDMNNPDQTVANQHYLESQGLQPLPVFHTGEDWKYLEYYCERYKYIAIGKIIPYANRPEIIMPWLAKCFRIANGRSVIHGLGVTNWKLMNSFPFYSVDSSTWSAPYRFGRVGLFDRTIAKMVLFMLNDRAGVEKNARLIRRYGFEPWQFWNAEKKTIKGNHLAVISAMSFLEIQKYITSRFGERTIDSNVYK